MRSLEHFDFLSIQRQTAAAASWEVTILSFTELWLQMPPELLQALSVTKLQEELGGSESEC